MAGKKIDSYIAARKHVHDSIRNRLRLYFAVAVALLCMLGYEVFLDQANLYYGIICVLVGVLVGWFTSRMYKLSWNTDSGKVVAHLDVIGIVVFCLYIAFSIYRTEIIGSLLPEAVGSITISVIAGVMIGRMLSIRDKVLKILNATK